MLIWYKKARPIKHEQATKIVLEQAEILCRDWSGEESIKRIIS
jgi:hypothetical protein